MLRERSVFERAEILGIIDILNTLNVPLFFLFSHALYQCNAWFIFSLYLYSALKPKHQNIARGLKYEGAESLRKESLRKALLRKTGIIQKGISQKGNTQKGKTQNDFWP
jgi:hypothetical protein